MPDVTMSMEEYLALIGNLRMQGPMPEEPPSLERLRDRAVRKSKRSTKYSRAYKREFRKIAPTYKKKDGTWKKDGFKKAVRAAHRAAKKSMS